MAFAATASKRGAFADMDKAAIDIAKALARFLEVTIFELRGEWRRLHRMPPPMRLSRDLLARGEPRLSESVAGLLRLPCGDRGKAAIRPLLKGARAPVIVAL